MSGISIPDKVNILLSHGQVPTTLFHNPIVPSFQPISKRFTTSCFASRSHAAPHFLFPTVSRDTDSVREGSRIQISFPQHFSSYPRFILDFHDMVP